VKKVVSAFLLCFVWVTQLWAADNEAVNIKPLYLSGQEISEQMLWGSSNWQHYDPFTLNEKNVSKEYDKATIPALRSLAEDYDRQYLVLAANSQPEDKMASTGSGAEGKERWSSFLPLMGEEARKRGYDLPLPFGVNINFLLLERDIEVTDVEAGLNSEPAPVPIDLAIDTKSSVSNVTAMFDTWILPFLNVYFLAGYTQSDSAVNVQFTIPGPGPAPDVPVDLDLEGSVDGPTVGGGLTLATGYRNFFLPGGANNTYTDLGGIFDEAVNAIVAVVRTGWRGPVGNTNLSVWIGGTYWDTRREVTGSIPIGNNTVFFKVLQGPVNPANMNFGTNVEISKKLHLAIDVGTNFDDMNSLIASFTYRF
jgi:hypothetical protein